MAQITVTMSQLKTQAEQLESLNEQFKSQVAELEALEQQERLLLPQWFLIR